MKPIAHLAQIFTCCTALFLFAASLPVTAQGLRQKYADRLTRPRAYLCLHRTDSIIVDGEAKEQSWQQASFTDEFVDISGYGFPKPNQSTRAKMLWDEHYLYVYAELKEHDVWSNITKRDAVIYYDNDFEVFIDPQGTGHNYFEIETNARGVVFDLSLSSAYRNPRRPFVQFQWNCPGLRIATHVRGTLNNPNDTDEGWSVEMAIPREAIAAEFDNYLKEGNTLRVNFSRVEWKHDVVNGRYDRKKDGKGKYLPEDNWVWSPTGLVAMHMPERWGYVRLSKGEKLSLYPDEEPLRRFLWMLFYAQEDRWNQTHTYYNDIDQMGLTSDDYALLPKGCTVKLETTSRSYLITARMADGSLWTIDQGGYCAKVNP